MRQPTHYLITRGAKVAHATPERPFTPIAISPIADGFDGLRRAVTKALDDRATVFVPSNARAVARIKEAARAYMADLMGNMWLSEVRLIPDSRNYIENVDNVTEEAICWVLFNLLGEFPPHWQGPADGVIPRETPITVRIAGAEVPYAAV